MTTPDIAEARRLADELDTTDRANLAYVTKVKAASMLRALADELERLRAQVAPTQALLLAARDALSVCDSVSMSRDRRVVRDGCVMYLQTEEWCKWAEQEVAQPLRDALQATAPHTLGTAAPAQQAEPTCPHGADSACKECYRQATPSSTVGDEPAPWRQALQDIAGSIIELAHPELAKDLAALSQKAVEMAKPDSPLGILRDALAPATQAEPAAWLITGGRMFKDQVVLLEGTADTRISERKDGSQKVPLGRLLPSHPRG